MFRVIGPGITPSKVVKARKNLGTRGAQHNGSTSKDVDMAPEYIVDEKNRTLMTPAAMRREQERLTKRAIAKAQLRERIRASQVEQAWQEQLSKNRTMTDNYDRVRIDHDVFAVAEKGTKLVPIAGSRRTRNQLVYWNNSSYHVARNGELRRDPIANTSSERAHCRYFTRNGTYFQQPYHGQHILTTGICAKGTTCPYTHDMAHINLCRQYLAGKCMGSCIMSHQPNECNTPLCRYHLEDACRNEQCRYLHKLPAHAKNANIEVWTCRPFAVGGWCDRGSMCPFLHLYNCPDYEESALCPRGLRCKLTHTVTRRLQEMMSQPGEVDGVVVEDHIAEKRIISSYTIPSELLFPSARVYDFVIDKRRNTDLVFEVDLSDED